MSIERIYTREIIGTPQRTRARRGWERL